MNSLTSGTEAVLASQPTAQLQAQPPPPQSRLLALPTEVRLLIYKHLFVDVEIRESSIDNTPVYDTSRYPSAITRTCKLLQNETVKLLQEDLALIVCRTSRGRGSISMGVLRSVKWVECALNALPSIPVNDLPSLKGITVILDNDNINLQDWRVSTRHRILLAQQSGLLPLDYEMPWNELLGSFIRSFCAIFFANSPLYCRLFFDNDLIRIIPIDLKTFETGLIDHYGAFEEGENIFDIAHAERVGFLEE